MQNAKYIRQKRSASPVLSYLQELFLNQKLNSWTGFLLLALMAGAFGFLLAKEFIVGVSVLGLILGLFVLLACVLNAELGLYINMIYILTTYHFARLFFSDAFPVGVISDVLVVATFLGLFIRNHDLSKDAGSFVKSRPIILLLIAFVYLCLEVLNPAAHSVEGWFSVIRKVLASVLITFVAYNVFSDYKKIWRFLKVLFICAVLTGIYGCLQQWHGLFGFEEQWVKSNEIRYALIFVGWHYRKFSFMSDPTAFGLLMAGCALLFIIIGINQKRAFTKYALLTGSLFMILGMAYSGTRTANAMLVGGIGLFVLLTIHKKTTKLFAVFAVLSFLFLMYVPIYSDPTLIRFRTSFNGTKNESYMVREVNRAAIQPYIYKHPFGGGLSTTGGNGEKYNPGHPLAGFPPDSGYLNKALETGWVGLALNCLVYFVTLLCAVKGYFKSNNARIKTLFAASAAFLFSFYLAELVQETVGLFANLVIYNAMVALVVRLRELSKKEEEAIREEVIVY